MNTVSIFPDSGGICWRCQQNCQQTVVNEYARVVADFARLLCRIVVKSVQIKGLEVQVLPLEPFHKALTVSDLLSSVARLPAEKKPRQNSRELCQNSAATR